MRVEAPRGDQHWNFDAVGSTYHQYIGKPVAHLQHTGVLGQTN